MKKVYSTLVIVGFIAPYSLFLPWLLEHGFDFTLFFSNLFSNPIGGAFGLDVIISSITLIVFIMIEGKKMHMSKLWIPILGTLSVGVSFGLPLFLYMREMVKKK